MQTSEPSIKNTAVTEHLVCIMWDALIWYRKCCNVYTNDSQPLRQWWCACHSEVECESQLRTRYCHVVSWLFDRLFLNKWSEQIPRKWQYTDSHFGRNNSIECKKCTNAHLKSGNLSHNVKHLITLPRWVVARHIFVMMVGRQCYGNT